MDIIAASYNNIGPFKDQAFSIFFQKGKYLVKAPIGYGKSFLFFDAPIYGLYKYQTRKLLNTKSTDGQIQLLFQIYDDIYLIVRNIRQGKSRESCTSRLYRVNSTLPVFDKQSIGNISDIKQYDQDIFSFLTEQGVKLEEMTFKNERDLDQNLASILPPREVFLSTVFLMQDSDNIFQMTPADRINVFKNIFNLVLLDEAKDKIARTKRENQAEIKVLSSTEQVDQKLQSHIRSLLNGFSACKEYTLTENIIIDHSDIMQDLTNIQDKIGINNFSLEEEWFNLYHKIQKQLEQQLKTYQTGDDERKNIHQSCQNIELQITQIVANITYKEKESEDIQHQIKSLDPHRIENFKKQKKTLYEEQQLLLSKIDFSSINDFIDNHKYILSTSEYDNIGDVYVLNSLLDYLMNKGSELRSHIDNIDKQFQLQKMQTDNIHKQIELQKSAHGEKSKLLENNINTLSKQIQDLQGMIQQESMYNCSKIGGDCPFIQDIKEVSLRNIQQQVDTLSLEKRKLEKDYKVENTSDENKDLEDKLKDLEHNFDEKNIEEQKKQYGSYINSIKSFLSNIERKYIKEIYQRYVKIQDELKILENKIQNSEDAVKRLEDCKTKQVGLQASIQELDKQKVAEEKKLVETKKTLDNLEQKLATLDVKHLQDLEDIVKNIHKTLLHIQNLVEDYVDQKINLKTLQEKEKLVNKLYQIFSREILLYVLEDNLPILSEIINNFLSQVVDFQLDIKLLQKGEKLEMETVVYDKDGERDVRSLSGGQKVILKLVRMIAISVYMKSPILFLDETINNLDFETVGKVADMIENFVKQNDMKLYIITHSPQIQSMNIWDNIISGE